MPLAFVEGGAVYFVHTDHLGTPQVLTDGAVAVVWNADYAPFGVAEITGGLTFNLRFPGQYFDAETGAHYNHFRTYDPSLGRYIESDPIGLAGGWNTYVYVDNNLLYWFDPDGLGKNKYTKPVNPNKPKGADSRQQSGARERNIGHPNEAEHSIRRKGGLRNFFKFVTRRCLPFLFFDPKFYCSRNPEICYPDVFIVPET